MSHTWKKLLSMLLVIVMVFQLLPTAAFAEDGDIVIVETQDPEEIQLIEDYGDEEDENEIVIQDLTVSFEATERRGETEKHFRLSDGSFAAASYNQPVHYQNGTGDWQEIDNTLEARDGSYLARAGMVEKEFSLFPESDYLFRYSFDGYTLVFTAVEPIGDEKGEEDVELPVEIEEPADESEEPEDPAEESETEPGEEPEPEDPDPGEETDPGEDTEPGDEDPEIIVGNSAPADGGEDITDPSEEEDEEPEIIIVETEPEDELVEEEPEEPTEVKAPEEAVLLDPETDEDLAKAGYRRITGEKLALNVENAKSDIDVFGLTLEQAADLTRLTSTLCYEDILPGVSYVYRNIGYNIKESIVIEAPQEEYCFSFAVKTNGLTIREEEDGSLTFVNAAGEPVFVIPAPFLFDAAGEYSDAAAYRISEYEGGAILTIEADKDWLNDPARVFPVTLDPTASISIYTQSDGMTANFISSDSNTPGTHQQLYVGYVSDGSGGSVEQQIFAGFDIIPNIPSNCIVIRAQLELVQTAWSSAGTTAREYGIYEVTGGMGNYSTYNSWINSLVWNANFLNTNVSSTVLDYITAGPNTIGTHFMWDVTRVVKTWYSGGTGIRAFCIKMMPPLSGYGRAVFPGYSWNLADTVTPHLYVDYRDDVGLESYYTAQSSGIDRAGAGYIGDFTQALTLVKEDLSAASTAMPVSFSHVYNSAYAGQEVSAYAPSSCYANMKVGEGWKLSFQQSIQPQQGDHYLRYLDADGTIHYFQQLTYTNPNVYLDEEGLGLKIVKESLYQSYSLYDLKGNKMYFADNYLRYIKDESGNKIYFNRNNINQVISITRENYGQSSETIANFEYTNNYLSKITDARGNTEFTYEDNRLIKIKHPDGTIVRYSYYSDGRLKKARDTESEYSVLYQYNSAGRIKQYTEYGNGTAGASVKVDGEEGITTYRYCGKDRILNNSDDLISECAFDYMGRTITSSMTNVNKTVIYGASGGQYSINSGTSGSNNRLSVGTSVGMRPVGNPGYSFTTQNMLTDSRLTHTSGYSLNGTPGSTSRITQTLYAIDTASSPSTSPEQTYIFSGWAKADSVSLNHGANRRFELRATITYTDTTEEVQKLSYCADSTQWQYLVLPIVPKESDKTIDSIKFGFYYDHNANSAQFKLGCVTKESAATYKWDEDGNLTSVSTPESATPTYTYEGADLLSQVTRGNGKVEYTYYDNTHRVKYVTNNDVRTRLNYDTIGNVSSTVLTGDSLTIQSDASYTNNGNLLDWQTDARGITTEYDYGTDEINNVYKNIYKYTGQPNSVTNAEGTNDSRTVTTTLNSQNGRVIGSSTTDVSLAYSYSSGRLTTMQRNVTGTNSSTQIYAMDYDDYGNLIQVGIKQNPNTIFPLATYEYASGNGVLTKMTYGNGQYEEFSYDNLERVIEKKNYSYDTNNNLVLDGRIDYSYYGEGSLNTLVDYLNNRKYSFTYDNIGRLSGLRESLTDQNAAPTSTVQIYSGIRYDEAQRLIGYSYDLWPNWNGPLNAVPVGMRSYSFTYSDDEENNFVGFLTDMTTPVGDLHYNYNDGLKRLTSRTGPAYTKSYTYYNEGLNGLPSNTTDLVATLTNGSFGTYVYDYDALGNITSIKDGNNTVLASYEYDSQGQLTKETRSDADYPYVYIYDAGGNILRIELDDSNHTTIASYTYGNSVWPDKLMAYNNQSITYDNIGNPTTYYDGTTFSWTHGRQLKKAVKGNQTLTFKYDSDGLRLIKDVNGVEHKYIWQGGKLISEQYSNKTLEFFYDEAGNPFALSYNNNGTIGVYYYVTNLQGDVVKLVKANGEVKATYEYDAWGNILNADSLTNLGNINPLRYRGYYYDAESGFYYLKSRYYDPKICRFINADGLASTGQGFLGCNMFAYCGNCPSRYSDHSGKYVEDHDITPYDPDGEIIGFNVRNDRRFLDPDYCLGFAGEYVEKYGESGRFAGMTPKRIALELYAHAELYYYAISLEDPLSSDNGYYSTMPFDNPGAMLGAAIISLVKKELMEKGEVITVNNDEGFFRISVYQSLWKQKTGEKYEEEA